MQNEMETETIEELKGFRAPRIRGLFWGSRSWVLQSIWAPY